MRAARRIAGNTGVIIAGKALGLGLSLAIVFQLTGRLSVAEFGQYNFVFFYVGMFSVLVEMGMSPILVREMARDRQRAGEILGTGVLIKIVLALLSFAGALVVLPAVTLDRLVWRLVFILGWQLFSYPLLTCVNIFKLELRMVYPTGLDLLRNGIYLAGVWYVLRTPSLGLAHLMALAVMLSFAVAVVLYGLSRRYVDIRFRYRPELARRLVKASVPLGLSQLAIICYYRVDTMMLLRMKGEEALGYYALAVKVAEVFSYLPAAFMVSVYPYLSRFWEESREKFLEATELSGRALLAVGLPVGIMGSLFAAQIVSVVPGAYGPSAASLRFLIWAEVFIFLNTALYNVLNAMNQERWNLWTTLVMLAGNVALNLALIPRYSHPGASFATLVTEALGFVFLAGVMLKLVGFRLKLGRLARIVLAGGILALALWVGFHQRPLAFARALLVMFLGSVAYAVLLYVLKVIDVREIRNLLQPSGYES